MSIEFTRKQEIAIKEASKWYKNQNSQVFTLAGYAGSGKSTVVKSLVNEIGITNNTKFATFTGKASLVLNRKGNSAETLHRLMYYIEDDLSYAGHTKLIFKKKDSLDSGIALIVVDEVSMVSTKLMKDLLSFGVPILCLGDPEQLPPVEGEDNGYLKNPNIFLDEIHRQAQGDPIIHLSMLARLGKKIELGAYGKKALVMQKSDVSDGSLKRAGQIICGYNKTRVELNGRVRKILGFKNELPDVGDKVICTRNNWQEAVEGTPLINGTIGHITEVEYLKQTAKTNKNKIILDFRPEFASKSYTRLECDTQEFLNIDKDNVVRNDFNKFDFGYAITTHKSQGSEMDNVMLFEEVLRQEMHSRWLYTGITRAKETLIIVKQARKYW